MTASTPLQTSPYPGFDDTDRMSGVKVIREHLRALNRMDQNVFWVKPRIKELEAELEIAKELKIP